jgi:hypothetical protein
LANLTLDEKFFTSLPPEPEVKVARRIGCVVIPGDRWLGIARLPDLGAGG